MTSEHKLRLLITSGDSPRECKLAVGLALKQINKEALSLGLDMIISVEGPELDPDILNEVASALVTLTGENAMILARRWLGTVQWIAQSPFRPHHKRRNWFIGIFELSAEADATIQLNMHDLKFDTFRAGGPGGQHQNTTDSAVRVTHIPTGQTAISKDERSQHRNKQTAIDRLSERMLLLRQLAVGKSKSDTN